MIQQVGKLDAAMMASSNPDSFASAYRALREPVANTMSSISQPFTNFIDNIGASGTAAPAPVSNLVSSLKSSFGNMLESATGVAPTELTLESMANDYLFQGAGTILGTAMTIYSVYVVSMLVLQLIWECEESEFELGANKALHACSYVGSYCRRSVLGVCVERRESYCCFNSPLSRIINEQARSQLGLGFGSSRNPQCEGLTIAQIQSLNWDQINLDEWIALIQQHGSLSDMTNLNLEMLTGMGNALSVGVPRDDAVTRTFERMEGIDFDRVKQEAFESVEIQAAF
jgi:conjugal transfer mating pair stabilization protein TraN